MADTESVKRSSELVEPAEPTIVLCRTAETAAHILKGVLGLWEIRAAVIQVNPARLACTVAELIIHEADRARALEAIRELEHRRSLPDWLCPDCASLIPATFDECWNCG